MKCLLLEAKGHLQLAAATLSSVAIILIQFTSSTSPFGPLQLHHSGFFAGAKWQPWKWNLLMLLLSVASIAVVSVAAAAVAAAAAAGVAFILALLN